MDRVIAYASRSLKPAVQNYPAHKLEFLALKWAITDKFHDYLYGANFEVITDNNPLTYVLTSAKLDASGHRWVAALANYNFSISYRSGKLNMDADGLSRLSEGSLPERVVYPDVLKAVLNTCHEAHDPEPLAACVAPQIVVPDTDIPDDAINAWVKVFRFIPEFRFLDLARHRFCETCKSGEKLGGGGGYRALDDENGRRLSRIADSFPESLAVNPVYL